MGASLFIGGMLIVVSGVFYLLNKINKAAPHETLMDKFRTIQPCIIGMAYDEIIDKLGQENHRTEDADSFTITYNDIGSAVDIFFEYNEESDKWVCYDYLVGQQCI